MSKEELPKRIKLLTHISIFPNGYEMIKTGGMYRRDPGYLHGLSYKRVKRALKNKNAIKLPINE